MSYTLGLISHYGQQGRNRKEEVIKMENQKNENDVFSGTQKHVTEGFLRGPWCRSARTHIRVQRAVCVHRHLPESARPMVTMQTFCVHRAWFPIYRMWGATYMCLGSVLT